jgi:hypothetical protein
VDHNSILVWESGNWKITRFTMHKTRSKTQNHLFPTLFVSNIMFFIPLKTESSVDFEPPYNILDRKLLTSYIAGSPYQLKHAMWLFFRWVGHLRRMCYDQTTNHMWSRLSTQNSLLLPKRQATKWDWDCFDNNHCLSSLSFDFFLFYWNVHNHMITGLFRFYADRS